MNDTPTPPAPPRRRWLVGVVGAAIAADIGWSALRRRRSHLESEAPKDGIPQLLDFGMDICEQCKKTRAILTRLQPEFAGRLQIRYLDVRDDASEALAERYRMRVIPLLVLLDAQGEEVWRHEGAPEEAQLRARLSQAIQEASRPRGMQSATTAAAPCASAEGAGGCNH